MKLFTVEDVQKDMSFEALTQDQERVVKQLIDTCNELRSKSLGYIQTRKDVLLSEFDREACKECVELSMVYEKGNEFLRKMMKVLFEKIARDYVFEKHVDDLVENMQFKLRYFNGNVEKVVDHYEAYYTCGKIVPATQTWRERLEEIEKGKVIYHEPRHDWAV